MTENRKPIPDKDLANILADMVVNDYVENQTRQAMHQVEKERTGKGCGCIRCAHSTVDEVNSWVAWVAAGNEKMRDYLDAIQYRVVHCNGKRGGWKIVQGNYDES